jgi:hypothetical protein
MVLWSSERKVSLLASHVVVGGGGGDKKQKINAQIKN